MAPPDEAQGGEQKHEEIYKWINFLILIGVLGYLLRKPAAEFFAQRSAAIRKDLEEGREALAAAQAQLRAVEEKLRNLEQEIASFRASASAEMEAEGQRLRQVTEREAEKIIESVRARIETAARAAQVDLKIYAAGQAVELAERMIRQRLDDATRGRLVARFVEGLKQRAGN